MKDLKENKRGNMWTDNTRGPPVYLIARESPDDEARLIAKEILELKAYDVISFRDVAVLCRNHYMTRVIEEEFIRKGIMYRLVGGVAFYDREEIKDLLCYLRLAMNPKDDFSFRRIINTPARGIGPKSIEHIEETAKVKSTSMFEIAGRIAQGDKQDGLLENKRKTVVLFVNLIDRISGMATRGSMPSDILDFLIREIGFEEYLKKDMDTFQQRWDNVLELRHVAGQQPNYEETREEPPGATPLTRFMQYISLLTGHENGEGREAVVISTLHSAKGLEWPVVFITGVETGTIPSRWSLASPSGLEEERRLFYVGSTRAKALLYWTHCRLRRVGHEMKYMTMSNFVSSVPDEVMDDCPPKKTPKFLRDIALFTGRTPLDTPKESVTPNREQKSSKDEDDSTKSTKRRSPKSPENSNTPAKSSSSGVKFMSAKSVMEEQSATRKKAPFKRSPSQSPSESSSRSPSKSPSKSPQRKRRHVDEPRSAQTGNPTDMGPVGCALKPSKASESELFLPFQSQSTNNSRRGRRDESLKSSNNSATPKPKVHPIIVDILDTSSEDE